MSSQPALPQNDPDQAKRERQLARARGYYQFDYSVYPAWPFARRTPLPKLPWMVMVAKILLAIGLNQLLAMLWLAVKKQLGRVKNGRAGSIKDFNEQFILFPLPEVAKCYRDDDTFVRLRLAGFNPVLLTGISQLPHHFYVTNDLFNKVEGFQNDSLMAAGRENRLFLIDYKTLDSVKGAKTKEGQKFPYAPLALFAMPKSGENRKLRAIAIQCHQDPRLGPVIGPGDGIAWERAKAAVNCADAQHHELVTHLIRAHMMQEPFALATPRCLAANHPLQVLLAPHFEGTLFINKQTQQQLLHPGSAIDKLMSGTYDEDTAVANRNRDGMSFNGSGLPSDLAARKVADKSLLPDYPYRDDAELIWNAIADWVAAYLSVYYQSDADVVADAELQDWGATLAAHDQGRMVGFGETPEGGVLTLAYLKETVTNIIFTGSALHAAVNFPQRPYMSYIPSVAFGAYAPAPAQSGGGEDDFLAMLPPLNMAQSQLNTATLLGTVRYTRLGQYGQEYFTDERVKPALAAFQSALAAAEEAITERNKTRDVPYPFLLPSNIPQSINV